MKRSSAIILAVLLTVNLVAHFLPFERQSLAPDDYAALVRSRGVSLQQALANTLRYPDRPLNYLVLYLQARFTGDHPQRGFVLVFLSSTLLLLCVFLLFGALTGERRLALLAGLFYCLLPVKLETYHTPIFFNTNLASCLFVLSFYFFVRFTNENRRLYLSLSLLFYGTGIFWYEIGFFLPILAACYYLFQRKEKIDSRALLPYLSLMGIYAAYRLSGGFGFADGQENAHHIRTATLPFNLLELAHHLGGRYLLRTAGYGLMQFFKADFPWTLVWAGCNAALLILLHKRHKTQNTRHKIEPINNLFLACVFTFFALPILLNGAGGVAGRHLVLPSLALALWLALWCDRPALVRRRFWIWIGAGLLCISQGTAWSQVVSCRINAGIYRALKANAPQLQKAETVIIDLESFTRHIPFTLMQRDFNVLNTYYGVQCLEDWGLVSMVRLAGGSSPRTYSAVSTPAPEGDATLRFSILQDAGYRTKKRLTVTVPKQGSFLLNYADAKRYFPR